MNNNSNNNSGGDAERTVSLLIPQDAKDGDTLTFTVEGTTLELCVPEGAQPGDVLEIQLAAPPATAPDSPEEQDDEKAPAVNAALASSSSDADKTSVTLCNGATLEFFHKVPCDSKGAAKIGDDEHPDPAMKPTRNDGTHAHVWSAAKYCLDKVWSCKTLCSKLQPDIHHEDSTRILELGSGSGVLGLSYVVSALRYDVDDARSNVTDKNNKMSHTLVLSDMPSALPLLKHNTEHNRSHFPSNVNVECRAIDWTKRNSASLATKENKFDVIVGSDLLYNTETLGDLAETIHENLNENGTILLSVRWRKPITEREFFRKTATNIEWTLLIAPCCDLHWDEFGNPDCEASNKYFRQQTIAVNGELLPLGEIDEDDMEKMSDREHEAFENCFLQVYLGKKKPSNDKKNEKKRSHEAMSEQAQTQGR